MQQIATVIGTSRRSMCKLPSYAGQFNNLQIKVKIKPHSLAAYEEKGTEIKWRSYSIGPRELYAKQADFGILILFVLLRPAYEA